MAITTIEDAQRQTEEFLTGQMVRALQAVDYAAPSFGTTPGLTLLEDAARAIVEVRHVRGASDAGFLVAAFEDELLVQVQLNVWRFVVVYRIPAVDSLDAPALAARFERWRLGAEHAGWTVGWREATAPQEPSQRFVETYCYAAAERNFLDNPLAQLYWRTDIVQMTRYFMLEARRCGVSLSPRRAGYRL